jgi:hypothetical protein
MISLGWDMAVSVFAGGLTLELLSYFGLDVSGNHWNLIGRY